MRPAPPLVIAHRGASAEAPENTIAAFERALAVGADALQLDVHLSRDDQPVVIHDFTLERTTDGSGPVRAHTVRELKRLDAGGWLGAAFRGQRRADASGGARALPGACAPVDHAQGRLDPLPGHRGAHRRPARGATTPWTGRWCSPWTGPPCGACGPAQRRYDWEPSSRIGPSIWQADLAADWTAVCPAAAVLGPAELAAIRAAGQQCHVWTVNEPALMDRLVEWGVDGIITARPDSCSPSCRSPPGVGRAGDGNARYSSSPSSPPPEAPTGCSRFIRSRRSWQRTQVVTSGMARSRAGAMISPHS